MDGWSGKTFVVRWPRPKTRFSSTSAQYFISPEFTEIIWDYWFNCWVYSQVNIIFNPSDNTQLLSSSDTHVLFYNTVSLILHLYWQIRHTCDLLLSQCSVSFFFQVRKHPQVFALAHKKVNISQGKRTTASVTSISVKYDVDYCLSIEVFTLIQLCKSAPRGCDTAPGVSEIVKLAAGSLSTSVFHCKLPLILTATAAGSLLIWDVSAYVTATENHPKVKCKILPLQNAPITCLAATDR